MSTDVYIDILPLEHQLKPGEDWDPRADTTRWLGHVGGMRWEGPSSFDLYGHLCSIAAACPVITQGVCEVIKALIVKKRADHERFQLEAIENGENWARVWCGAGVPFDEIPGERDADEMLQFLGCRWRVRVD